MNELKSLSVDLNHIQEGLFLYIDERIEGTLFYVEDANNHNEAENQLIEGFFYDYTFSNPDYYFSDHIIIQPHSRKKFLGTIAPNTYVGTLEIPIQHSGESVGNLNLEVQSKKVGYRDDYRMMLEFITEKCTELLMQSSSPVTQHFEINHSSTSTTLYQKFAFVKSIISTEEFSEAIHRIIANPNTCWNEIGEEKDIRKLRKIGSATLRAISQGKNRTDLPSKHFLRTSYGISSLPRQIPSTRNVESIDTPENRFVKFVLEVLLKFCSDINNLSQQGSRLEQESLQIIEKIESYLHHSFFNEISRPQTLSINSPILQRKGGYREILRVWLMFDLAAKLIWTGGDEVYKGGKKDISVLYEYWLFFKLLDLFQNIFKIEPKTIEQLIKQTNNGLDLQLKQGNQIALFGVYSNSDEKLKIRFSYNRSFGGGKKYPTPGSWTTLMRPDYTLSIWPAEYNESEAEEKEVIIHIHFDAKYKIANLLSFLDKNENTENHKKEGTYKNSDLLKMHAYKDAIRRTGGAYILYPGHKSLLRRGFHEILPGLGAFPVRPIRGDEGTNELRDFIFDVLGHLSDRNSQRKKLATATYNIFNQRDN